jgi:hypothetical protein
MLKCSICGRDLQEKDALIHKTKDGSQAVICPECFKKKTGIDYNTFAIRKENAKQTIIAVVVCLAATIYAAVEKGLLYGIAGLILTILVYCFASRAK